MTDTQIIRQLEQKDEEALLHLQEQYEVYCYAIALRLLRDEELAQECVSDVWLAVWESGTRPQNLRAWLAKITRNTALHYIERCSAKKRSASFVLLDELAECIPDPLRQREMEAQMLRELLDNFVKSLKPEAQRLFLCRYWYGYSVAELSERFGFSQGRINSILFRSRQKLKKALEKEGISLE